MASSASPILPPLPPPPGSPLSPPLSPFSAPPPGTAFASNFLLFCLVACFASTVDISSAIQRRSKIARGVVIALGCQFILLPLVGFLAVRAYSLDRVEGVMLMVVLSSPGGAYSNWFCSVFNADLMLSVAATACSTLLSAIFLPVNLLLYLSASYGTDVLGEVRWDLLIVSIAVVTAGVSSGMLLSCRLSRMSTLEAEKPRAMRIRRRLGAAGNLCGLVLIAFSAAFSSVNAPLWNRPLKFYPSTATPALLAMTLSLLLTQWSRLRLAPAERVAVTIECLYQNTGISMSIAFSVFSGSEAARAAGTPLFYGVCQAVFIPIFALVAWQLGWTYAPRTDHICKVISTDYQHHADGGADATLQGTMTGIQTLRPDETDTQTSSAP